MSSFLGNVSSWLWGNSNKPQSNPSPISTTQSARNLVPVTPVNPASRPVDVLDSDSEEEYDVASPTLIFNDVSTPLAPRPYRSQSRPRSLARRKEKEPSKFTGKTDWTDYLSHFTAVSQWNQWTYDEMGLQLAISLTEEAREVLGSISAIQKHDYNVLVDALTRRFSPEGRESQFSLALMNLFCKPDQDVTSYGHDLRRMATKAYPGQSVDEKILVDMFIKGLQNQDMKRHVYLSKPSSLSEAITCGVAYETFDKPCDDRSSERIRKPKLNINPVQTNDRSSSDSATNDIAEMLSKLNASISELKQSQPLKLTRLGIRVMWNVTSATIKGTMLGNVPNPTVQALQNPLLLQMLCNLPLVC